MRRIKAKDIVQDMSIYPRCAIDKGHVHTLALVLEGGAELPPLVICRKSRRLVDGFHRLNAHLEHFGPECEVAVLEKDYKQPRDMWLDSIRFNAKHGLPLTRSDREHCRLTCTRMGVKAGDMAEALGVRTSAIGPLTVSKPASKPALTTTPAIRHRADEHRPRFEDPHYPDGRDRLSSEGNTGPRLPHNAVDVEINWSAKKVIAAAVAWHTAFEDGDKRDQARAIEALNEAVSDYLEHGAAA